MENLVMSIFLFFLGITFLILYVSIYNSIQKTLIRIKEAESQIDESLRSKYDLLLKEESIINSNTGLKQKNFIDLTDNIKISNFEMDRKLTKIEDIFDKIRSDYTDDLDIQILRDLLIDLKIINEKNEAAKSYYNKYTTKLNLIIKKFPSNIIARIHGIKEHLYFDNKNMSDGDIFDFKF